MLVMFLLLLILRFGHAPELRLKVLHHLDPLIHSNFRKPRDTCHLARQNRLSFPGSSSSTKACFGSCWYLGTYEPTYSVYGHLYFLTTVDDFSISTLIFLMKTNSEAQSLLQHIFLYLHKNTLQFSTFIKCIRSDQGQEFNLADFFAEEGTVHQRSCASTPQK